MRFAYWDFRGIGEPGRLMLAYGKINYEDKRYTSDEEWNADKYSLGLAFPNLPYLIDGDLKLTESKAIYKYLAKKLDLLPCSDQEIIDCNILEGIIHDLRLRLIALVLIPGLFTTRLEETKGYFSEKVEQLEKFLEGRKFVAGDRLTHIDFDLYESLDHNRTIFKGVLDDKPNVRGYIKRFESLEEISKCINSDGYKKFPIFPARAMWGGKDHDDSI